MFDMFQNFLKREMFEDDVKIGSDHSGNSISLKPKAYKLRSRIM